MKNNKFLKSTIILMIGGLLTKVLGMIIKIIETRLIGTEGIGLFMLISPTFSLLIALATFGFPSSISTLVARDTYNNKKLVTSSIPISLLINLTIIIILFFSGHFIANNLLHESRIYYAILSIGFVLPFISISNIIRGYFFGKQKMFPHVLTNFFEDIVRIILLIIGIPIMLLKGIEYCVAFLVISNIFSELTSIIIFIFFLPKNFSISKDELIPDKKVIKDILSLSIPTTFSRLIGNIGYFFEPIILTFVLLKVGYSNNFIIEEYGILNGYVMPLLLLPSFFTMAISQALIPVISEAYGKKNIKYAKKKMKTAIFLSLIVGIPCTIFFTFFPSIPLKLIYNTNVGINYLRVIAPLFLIFYIQTPLTSALQATGKASIAMRGTLGGVIIRTLLLFILSHLKIGLWGLIIATLSNVFYVTIHQAYHLNKLFKE